MTPLTHARGRRYAVFGLGGSGRAVLRALAAGGAEALAWDDQAAARERVAAEGHAIADLAAIEWQGLEALVLAPGVPLTHPAPHWTVHRAAAAGVPVIGDIELFFRERAALAPGSPVVAITGTNGKSTTTALVAHILARAGHDVAMGGNIGANILDLPPPASRRIHVIEISSFQIDLTPGLAPSIGIQLNLTPDHIDRHGSLEAYAAVKERLVQAAEHAIVGVDDAWSRAMADRRAAAGRSLTRVSVAGLLPTGVALRGQRLLSMRGGEESLLADLADAPGLRGLHNAQNAAAAAAAVLALGLDRERLQTGLASYRPLPHRMEAVGRVGATVFINDSKATNAESTMGALRGGNDLYWILGGRPKEGGIDSLLPHLAGVRRAYLIGEAAEAFARVLAAQVPVMLAGTLDRAVTAAARDAAEEGAPAPVVLLSPACASYDQFRNFEERGEAFRSLVSALAGFEPAHREGA